MKILREKKGFTLVEIMIVVAIIGLLAAIAIPNLLRARINANDNAVQGDLRAFSTAVESYRAAQNPPVYPADLGELTSASPPYLDPTWIDGGFTKHGHTLNYRFTAGNSVYAMTADRINNQSVNSYCIDQSGVLRVNLAGRSASFSTSSGCTSASVVQQ